MAIKQVNSDVDFQRLRRITIYDNNNDGLPFSRLFEGNLGKQMRDEKKSERILVVFIRHFFCGLCQEYLRRLAEDSAFNQANLTKLNTKIVIIGCGAPSLINSYRSGINIPTTWSMYADPTLQLYDALKMRRSYSLGDHPEYIQQSTLKNMLGSVAQAIRRLSEGDVFSAGDWNVQGGEFLFEYDPLNTRKWDIVWNHRMVHSRDHTEVDQIANIINMSTETLQSMPDEPTRHSRNSSLSKDGAIDCGTHHEALKRRSSIRRYVSVHRHSRQRISIAGC